MVGPKQVASNVGKSKFMFFHMRHRRIPQLHFYLNKSPIDYVTEFNFLGSNVML